MCGIAGILFKQQEGPIGDILIKMLADLNRRGPIQQAWLCMAIFLKVIL